jgi:hypothetical protein
VVQAGGETYEEYSSEAKILVPLIFKFILEHGDTNVVRDGSLSAADNADGDAIQNHQVIFGSCGQDHTEERIDGHCAPASIYGFNVFEKEKDKEKREKIKMMVGLYSISCRNAQTTLRQSNLVIRCLSTTKEETSDLQRKSGHCLIAVLLIGRTSQCS